MLNFNWFRIRKNYTEQSTKGVNNKPLAYRLQAKRQLNVKMGIDQWRNACFLAQDFLQPDRQPLIALYYEIINDAHLSALMQIRTLKAISSDFTLNGLSEDGQNLVFNNDTVFRKWLRFAHESIYYGHSLIEFVVGFNQIGNLVLLDALLIPRTHVEPVAGRIYLDADNKQKFFTYRDNEWGGLLTEVGDPSDLGLLKKAAPYAIWKRFAQSDWSRLSERYGMPFMVIRTASRDERELDAKAEMAANLGSAGFAILDDQDEIQMLETARPGAHQIYQENIKANDEAMSKLILGQTLATDSGASYAQATVHERVLDAIINADKQWLQGLINSVFVPAINRLTDS